MKINIKLLKELLSNLDESKEIDICCAYSSGEPQLELVKQLKPTELEYYKLIIWSSMN